MGRFLPTIVFREDFNSQSYLNYWVITSFKPAGPECVPRPGGIIIRESYILICGFPFDVEPRLYPVACAKYFVMRLSAPILFTLLDRFANSA